jgi:hypothetical protein
VPAARSPENAAPSSGNAQLRRAAWTQAHEGAQRNATNDLGGATHQAYAKRTAASALRTILFDHAADSCAWAPALLVGQS